MEQVILDKLKEIVGEEGFSTRIADLYTYGFDASIYHRTPDVILQPRTTEHVSAIMRVANEHKVPVVPRGGGTGLCGNAVPIEGGIVMDMSRMNAIKEINVEDLYCVVEAGVIYNDINKALAPYHFFFPPSPGSAEACEIGGMVALNASGMRAIKYGATRDYVLGMTFVKADGTVVEAGTRTLKDSSGYQLARLLVGSEGTLGVITEVILKIAPRPKSTAMVLAAFDALNKAGRCVSAIIAKPLIPSSLELMDRVSIQAVNKALGDPLPDCEALCLIEVDGEPEIVEAQIGEVEAIAKDIGAIEVEATTMPSKMSKWTSSRKSILASLSSLRPEFVSVSLADDMAVPISRIPDAVAAFHEIAARNHVIVATYGHAADGNLHTKMLLDPVSEEAWRNGEQAVMEIFDKCVELGGTVTGEHGVGMSKAPSFQRERASALGTMIEIKRAMDPNNILNPGKLMAWEGSIIHDLRYPCVPDLKVREG